MNPLESSFKKFTTFVVTFGLGALMLLARIEWATHAAGRRVPSSSEIATFLAIMFMVSVYLTQRMCKEG